MLAPLNAVSIHGDHDSRPNVTTIADQMNSPARLRLISTFNDRIPSASAFRFTREYHHFCINDGHVDLDQIPLSVAI